MPARLHFVTFGQDHAHSFNGKTFDKDCVAVFEAPNAEIGRSLAFSYFGQKFCFEYPEEYFDVTSMKYFPRGYVQIGIDKMTDDEINKHVLCRVIKNVV